MNIIVADDDKVLSKMICGWTLCTVRAPKGQDGLYVTPFMVRPWASVESLNCSNARGLLAFGRVAWDDRVGG